jgi:hypothetical protein
MPLKTEAVCTVTAEKLNLSNLGFRKVYVAGDTVRLPADVANEFADQGVVTITTPADDS